MKNEILVNERLSFNDFLDILNEYYTVKLRKTVNLIPEFTLRYDKDKIYPNLNLYYSEYICGDKVMALLNEEEILEPLKVHANNLGLELISYKYNGFVKQNESYIDGVWLYMQEKNLVKKLLKR